VRVQSRISLNKTSVTSGVGKIFRSCLYGAWGRGEIGIL
jgi:hypothetical protein